MQWPNQDIQPPRNPQGSRIERRIQRYPPPVSGNADPSSMYAMAVNIVTTKFRPNARIREGPVIAYPGPTSRKIVVPIVGPSPIIVISRRPRSRRNLTSTSRPWAIGSPQTRSGLLGLPWPADFLQIHERIVELGHITQRADGPRIADPNCDLDVQEILSQDAVVIWPPGPQPLAVHPDSNPFHMRLEPCRRFNRPLEGRDGLRCKRRANILMRDRAELDARLEGGAVSVGAIEIHTGRIGSHRIAAVRMAASGISETARIYAAAGMA